MMLKCAICGKMKPKEEFPVIEYIIRNTGGKREVVGRYFCICRECLKKIKEEDDRELIEDGCPF